MKSLSKTPCTLHHRLWQVDWIQCHLPVALNNFHASTATTLLNIALKHAHLISQRAFCSLMYSQGQSEEMSSYATHVKDSKEAVAGPKLQNASMCCKCQWDINAFLSVCAETDGAAERMLTPSHMARDLMPSQAPESIIRLYCKPGRPVAASELSTAAEFAPYAMAAYGSLFYVYASRNRTSACCQLCLRACCSCCMSDVAAGKVSVFEQDINLPKFDPSRVMTKAAVCEIANINERDLKHVESSNSFNKQAPYFIALNRDSRTVVVSIRGTFRCVALRFTHRPVSSSHLCI